MKRWIDAVLGIIDIEDSMSDVDEGDIEYVSDPKPLRVIDIEVAKADPDFLLLNQLDLLNRLNNEKSKLESEVKELQSEMGRKQREINSVIVLISKKFGHDGNIAMVLANYRRKGMLNKSEKEDNG